MMDPDMMEGTICTMCVSDYLISVQLSVSLFMLMSEQWKGLDINVLDPM